MANDVIKAAKQHTTLSDWLENIPARHREGLIIDLEVTLNAVALVTRGEYNPASLCDKVMSMFRSSVLDAAAGCSARALPAKVEATVSLCETIIPRKIADDVLGPTPETRDEGS